MRIRKWAADGPNAVCVRAQCNDRPSIGKSCAGKSTTSKRQRKSRAREADRPTTDASVINRHMQNYKSMHSPTD
eukprot:3862171-Alexandrium_andersonii.AAC.1